MPTFGNKHAVIMGGSMAGLLAARVLSDFFERVTIYERDPFGAEVHARKGVPQGHHSHALLSRGYQIFSSLFKTFEQDLRSAGAVISDVRDRYDFYYRGYWPHAETDMVFAGISRPALERIVYKLVNDLPNVTIEHSVNVTTLNLAEDRARVNGIEIERRDTNEREHIAADLVVDARGRGSQLPKWLSDQGYDAPEESVVKVDIRYATRFYKRMASNADARATLVVHEAPTLSRAGCIIAIEDGRYSVTLADMFGRDVPTQHDEFMEFARSLAAPDIYHLISKHEPLSDIQVFNFPASRWRHYERLNRFPTGLAVVGDAVSSFNPIYGQGMTVAAMDALAMGEWLKSKDRDPKKLFKAIAGNVEMAWGISVGADFSFPETEGSKAFGTDFLNKYFKRFVNKASHDPALMLAFFKVNQMMSPPSTLLHPALVARVLLGRAPKKIAPTKVLAH